MKGKTVKRKDKKAWRRKRNEEQHCCRGNIARCASWAYVRLCASKTERKRMSVQNKNRLKGLCSQ